MRINKTLVVLFIVALKSVAPSSGNKKKLTQYAVINTKKY